MKIIHGNENAVRHLQAMASLKAFLLEMDTKGQILYRSESWKQFLQSKEIDQGNIPESFFELLHHDEVDHIRDFFQKLNQGSSQQEEIRLQMILADDLTIWLLVHFMKIELGGRPVIRAIFQDITEIIIQERMVNFMAYHDNLTGLPNRLRLEEELEKQVENAKTSGIGFSIGFIGLDNFKFINNSIGHKLGDRIIFALSKRLRSVLGNQVTLGRWGGDIFLIILPEVTNQEEILKIGQSLIVANNQPVQVQQNQFYITHSIGFAVFPDDGDVLEKLLSGAEMALQRVKSLGRNHCLLISDVPQFSTNSQEMIIRNHLKEAIRKREIEPYFQPKIDVKTRKVKGMESLARWNHAELGWVSPGVFIPIAESMGLLDEIGNIIAEKSVLVWSALSGYHLKLAINVSLQQLMLANLVDTMQALVAKHNLDSSYIILEITESMPIMEMDRVLKQLHQLRKAGFLISIDDFGTGYSSFSRLHEMPANELKIDISFVRRIHTPDGYRIIKAIVDVGKSLDMKIIAEGVEDQVTTDKLAALEVDMIQGYFFSKPLSSLEFIDFVRQQNIFDL